MIMMEFFSYQIMGPKKKGGKEERGERRVGRRCRACSDWSANHIDLPALGSTKKKGGNPAPALGLTKVPTSSVNTQILKKEGGGPAPVLVPIKTAAICILEGEKKREGEAGPYWPAVSELAKPSMIRAEKRKRRKGKRRVDQTVVKPSALSRAMVWPMHGLEKKRKKRTTEGAAQSRALPSFMVRTSFPVRLPPSPTAGTEKEGKYGQASHLILSSEHGKRRGGREEK